MTQEQALAEAKRRWGKRADAWWFERGDPAWRFYMVANAAETQYGCGQSWEAAFADADRREAAK